LGTPLGKVGRVGAAKNQRRVNGVNVATLRVGEEILDHSLGRPLVVLVFNRLDPLDPAWKPLKPKMASKLCLAGEKQGFEVVLEAMHVKPGQERRRINFEPPALALERPNESLFQFVTGGVGMHHVRGIEIGQSTNVSVRVISENVHRTQGDFRHQVSFPIHGDETDETSIPNRLLHERAKQCTQAIPIAGAFHIHDDLHERVSSSSDRCMASISATPNSSRLARRLFESLGFSSLLSPTTFFMTAISSMENCVRK